MISAGHGRETATMNMITTKRIAAAFPLRLEYPLLEPDIGNRFHTAIFFLYQSSTTVR
ncbi:hypothetical protein [Thermodesulfovibrio thiophilus]|uniref:hypothetical protein n=1 Tax=Thermodesulfovibrio thiophilus TaxID=340095 RepID=UPI0012EC676D|nr:hypothetical protein [Thermodesulfovibrio thiophilus]